MTAAECAFGMSVRYYWHPERDLLLRWHNTTLRSETHFTYDDEGRVLHTQTNGIWNDDRFRYDPQNRETTYLPSGDARLAQRFRYDEKDNVTHEIDALGHMLQRVFDAAGFETAVTDANGHKTTKAYDIRGNVSRHVDAEGRATTYAWGPHGELDMVIDGAGKIRRWENDQHGNTLAETCAEGHRTRFVRDERGRLIRTIFPDGAEEHRAYDAHGRLVAITDARGGVTRFLHDPFGRTVAQTDALGHITRYEYAAGAGGFATPTAMIRPDGVRITRAYTEDGVLASVTDGEGRTWRYTYGAFDVLQSIQDPGGGKLSFAYDCEGSIVAVTNQVGVTYHLIRDAAGRVIAEEDFDGRRTEYTRDPGGRVVETKKPDGVRLVYGYDRTDKLTSIKSYAAAASATDPPLDETYYWYDRRGLLIKASNLAALVELERDGNGRIVRETTNGRAIESKLDARGNRIERRIGRGEPGEGLVKIGRDPLGMVASIAIDDHAPLVFTRDALGRETSRASAKGFRLEQSWDAVGQLMHQRVGTGEAERRYAWDKAGAPTSIDDAIWGETRYTYDVNGQVAKAEFGDGFTEKFAYDAAKNTAGVALEGPGLDASVSKLFAWRSTPGGVVQLARGPNGEMVALTHDVCGRVVERRVDRKGFRPKTWRYHWDAHDRLVRCDNPEGETWFYRYDPFGRRLTKVRKLRDTELAWIAQRFGSLVSADERDKTKIWTWAEPPNDVRAVDSRTPLVGSYFIWDSNVAAEEAPLRLDGSIDWDEATGWHFEHGGFRPCARQTPSNKLFYVVCDHLGTPREMFGEARDRQWAANFTTWGNLRGVRLPKAANDNRQAIYPRNDTPPENVAQELSSEKISSYCPIRFQGQWADCENGLSYNLSRYYDAAAEQYVQPDPIGLKGGSRPYSYVVQPTTMVDPLGLSATTSEPGVPYGVGPYNEIKGTLPGYDAHHVGQQAIARKLIPGYNPETAPAILVPRVGHTIRGPRGIVNRSTKGISNTQDLMSRDSSELQRVYPDLPDEQLQKLQQLNQQMYPGHF
jgi:RHS repeat-associated protein